MKTIKKIIAVSLLTAAPSFAFAQDVDWSGAYAGITTGNVTGNSIHCNSGGSGCDTPDTHGTTSAPTGSAISGFVGYNHDVNGSFIIGGEISFSESDAAASELPGEMGCGTTCDSEIRSLTTIALRAGKPIGKVLPFVSIGYTDTVFYGEINDSSGSEMTASTVSYGVGVDVALGDNWMMRGEFQTVNDPGLFLYDVENACGSPGCAMVENQYSVVKLGLGYRF